MTNRKQKLIQFLLKFIETTETREWWTVNDIFDESVLPVSLCKQLVSFSQGRSREELKSSVGKFLSNMSGDTDLTISVNKLGGIHNKTKWAISKNENYREEKNIMLGTNVMQWEYYLLQVLRQIKALCQDSTFSPQWIINRFEDGGIRDTYSFKNLNGRVNLKGDKVPTERELIKIFANYEGIYPRVVDHNFESGTRNVDFCIVSTSKYGRRWEIDFK